MNSPRPTGQQDPLAGAVPDETVEGFVSLGRQLAAKMAEVNFHSITATPAWTMGDVDAETDRAIERMEIASRDMLADKGADPDGADWREIWTAMETAYRETTANLLIAAGARMGSMLQ